MTKLILKCGSFEGGRIELSPAQLPATLGRSRSADITVNDRQLSRHHAELRFSASGQFVIHDLDSTNLTIVNEQDVSEYILQSGDCILLGDTQIIAEVIMPEADLNEKTTRDLTILPRDKTIEQ